jgi:hypothetical protein
LHASRRLLRCTRPVDFGRQATTAKLNRTALEHARSLVGKSRIVRDGRDDWSEHASSADDENLNRVHRCAVISLESRAAQNDHDEIARAAKQLPDQIDD